MDRRKPMHWLEHTDVCTADDKFKKREQQKGFSLCKTWLNGVVINLISTPPFERPSSNRRLLVCGLIQLGHRTHYPLFLLSCFCSSWRTKFLNTYITHFSGNKKTSIFWHCHNVQVNLWIRPSSHGHGIDHFQPWAFRNVVASFLKLKTKAHFKLRFHF